MHESIHIHQFELCERQWGLRMRGWVTAASRCYRDDTAMGEWGDTLLRCFAAYIIHANKKLFFFGRQILWRYANERALIRCTQTATNLATRIRRAYTSINTSCMPISRRTLYYILKRFSLVCPVRSVVCVCPVRSAGMALYTGK